MINANEAKEKAIDSIPINKTKELKTIELYIEDAASKGRYNVLISERFQETTLLHIRSLGYNVDTNYNWLFNHTIISWDKNESK